MQLADGSLVGHRRSESDCSIRGARSSDWLWLCTLHANLTLGKCTRLTVTYHYLSLDTIGYIPNSYNPGHPQAVVWLVILLGLTQHYCPVCWLLNLRPCQAAPAMSWSTGVTSPVSHAFVNKWLNYGRAASWMRSSRQCKKIISIMEILMSPTQDYRHGGPRFRAWLSHAVIGHHCRL